MSSSHNCIICDSSSKISKITDTININEEPEVTVITKLQFIAPEIEWSEQYFICEACMNELLSACKFKKRCLWVQHFSLKVETADESFLLPEIKQDCHSVNSDTDVMKFEDIPLHQEADSTNLIESHLTRYSRKEKCVKCGRKYGSVVSLKAHQLVCDGIGRHQNKSMAKFKCDKCNKYYMTNKSLRVHITTCDLKDTDSSTEQCTDSNCERNVIQTNQQEFTLDKQSAPSKKSTRFRTFICEVCGEKFTLLKEILKHCQTEHSMDMKTVKPYLCEKCNARFRTSSGLRGHHKVHIDERQYICTYCGKRFRRQHELSIHEKTHFSIRAFKCDLCEKSFKTSANRRMHKVVVHTSPSQWKNICKICGKRFPQKNSLDFHIRRHTGEKNFICHICNKGFTTKRELEKHEVYHSNIRPFKCEYCEMEYKQNYTYKVHLKRVHGIGNAKLRIVKNKFACHICPAKFPERRRLTRHLCKHSGLKPYACTNCDRKFSDKSYLNLHFKMKHIVEGDCV